MPKFSRLILACSLLALLQIVESCDYGVTSSGWIEPNNDQYVEEGNPVEMLCVLNTSHPNAVNSNWENLSFYIDGSRAAIPWKVEKNNDTSIRLSWDKAVVSPEGNYVVQCRLNNPVNSTAVCTRYITVGYPPLEVSNFTCTSYNWERLVCVWMEPYNPIHTMYALSYQVISGSRARRMTASCPGNRSPLPTFLLSKATASDPAQPNCTWRDDTTPPYIPSAKAFNFTMSMYNDLVPYLSRKTQPLGLVDNWAIMIPDPMEPPRAVSITPYSAIVTWKIPFNLGPFPPGLEFRVAYKIISSWANTSQYFEVKEAANLPWMEKKNQTYQIELTLPYPNARYNVSVWARSTVADPNDPRFWSTPSFAIFSTLPDKPCGPPEASITSFEDPSVLLERRSITIRWSQLPPSCENGHQSGYKIVLQDVQDNYLDSKNVTSINVTSLKFDDLDVNKAYRFLLYAYNSVGYSENASEIFVPTESNMPSAPENVVRISYDEKLFEIQWTKSTPSRGLSMATFGHPGRQDYSRVVTSYTVFWCRSNRDIVVCIDQLYSQTVLPTATSLNVTVPEPGLNYQFAVSANQGEYFSSGMTWSTCIVYANGTGSQIKQLSVTSATNVTLDVTWSLPCTVQGGIITGYNIYYCPVETAYESEGASCIQPPYKIFVGPSFNKYTITELEPYTMYEIVMSVENPQGEGQSSTPVLNRTSESYPSMPLDLNPRKVTNQSISLSWEPPKNLNGPSPFYRIYLNDSLKEEVFQTEATVKAESYTNYVVFVKACNGPSLCSPLSEPASVRTQIGAPSAPGLPKMKAKTESGVTYIQISWEPPAVPRGPIEYSMINISSSTDEFEVYKVEGDSTEQFFDMEQVCKSGEELKVHVMSVNMDEDGQPLMSNWSEEGMYPCKSEGLALGVILAISFSAAALVLIVLLVFYCGSRHQSQKRVAKTVNVKMPWEANLSGHTVGSSITTTAVKTPVIKDSSTAKTTPNIGNYYGKLNSKPTGMTPIIKDVKIQKQSSFSTDLKAELDATSDRQSHSSGLSSGHNSLSWRHVSGEISNDSGAEFDPSSPDVFSAGKTDMFIKAMASSTQDLTMPEEGYMVMQLREIQRNGASNPSLAQPLPYVQVGMAPPPSSNLAASPSAGYVTIGPSQTPVDSPNASPNLSVGSNDSLIAKSERTVSPIPKIVPLKRNSGYVEASMSPPVNESLPPAVSTVQAMPGYVTFKSQEMPNGTASPSVISSVVPSATTTLTTMTPGGYVTLGAVPANNNTPTSTHYVQMGSSQPNQTLA